MRASVCVPIRSSGWLYIVSSLLQGMREFLVSSTTSTSSGSHKAATSQLSDLCSRKSPRMSHRRSQSYNCPNKISLSLSLSRAHPISLSLRPPSPDRRILPSPKFLPLYDIAHGNSLSALLNAPPVHPHTHGRTAVLQVDVGAPNKDSYTHFFFGISGNTVMMQ